jgi:hypothetical protein
MSSPYSFRSAGEAASSGRNGNTQSIASVSAFAGIARAMNVLHASNRDIWWSPDNLGANRVSDLSSRKYRNQSKDIY